MMAQGGAGSLTRRAGRGTWAQMFKQRGAGGILGEKGVESRQEGHAGNCQNHDTVPVGRRNRGACGGIPLAGKRHRPYGGRHLGSEYRCTGAIRSYAKSRKEEWRDSETCSENEPLQEMSKAAPRPSTCSSTSHMIAILATSFRPTSPVSQRWAYSPERHSTLPAENAGWIAFLS